MEISQAIILGMLQGLTEFIPVSSSAHLILFPWFFDWKDPGLAFDVFLHLGTLCALMVYFFRELWEIASGGIQSLVQRRIGFEPDRQLFWMLIFGSIPAAIAGVLFHHLAEETFRAPLLIATMLSFVGFVVLWVDGHYPALKRFEELNFGSAFLIGIAQAFAIIPGVSRSGATMAMGRRLGFSRDSAAKFSFLLCIPIILGAVVMKIPELTHQVGNEISWSYVLSGFGSAFFFGMISIHFMLGYLRNADLALFTWYRLGLSIFVVVWSLFFKV
ncbi:MAG: undecaprenyl-diphosphate phosphatase [Proteobacteria bacterium]|nr:undecaprenyl-diphosphate phosphatase [Pseudomonadota bacterium]NBY20525.1 undecaprenyl-diphosphate phosphatase [bacterium]